MGGFGHNLTPKKLNLSTLAQDTFDFSNGHGAHWRQPLGILWAVEHRTQRRCATVCVWVGHNF